MGATILGKKAPQLLKHTKQFVGNHKPHEKWPTGYVTASSHDRWFEYVCTIMMSLFGTRYLVLAVFTLITNVAYV